jgi:hypothetical protein
LRLVAHLAVVSGTGKGLSGMTSLRPTGSSRTTPSSEVSFGTTASNH